MGVSLAQDVAEVVAVGVHGLILPAGHLRERDELPNEGPSYRLRQQEVVGRLDLPLLVGVGVHGPVTEGLEPLGALGVQVVVGAALTLVAW